MAKLHLKALADIDELDTSRCGSQMSELPQVEEREVKLAVRSRKPVVAVPMAVYLFPWVCAWGGGGDITFECSLANFFQKNPLLLDRILKTISDLCLCQSPCHDSLAVPKMHRVIV